jgi:hypothetical protein
VTDKEIIDIIRESALWKTLSPSEKVEAITYALKAAGRQLYFSEEEASYLSEVVGEIYSGYIALVDSRANIGPIH